MQMTEENLKLNEMSFQLKNLDIVSSGKQETLETRHKTSIAELERQRKRFMDQLQQVIWNVIDKAVTWVIALEEKKGF